MISPYDSCVKSPSRASRPITTSAASVNASSAPPYDKRSIRKRLFRAALSQDYLRELLLNFKF